MNCAHPLERLQFLLYWRHNTDHAIYCKDCDTYFEFPHMPELVGRRAMDVLKEWREAL